MSRIGRNPIPINNDVKVEKTGQSIKVSGPLGELEAQIHPLISCEIKESQIILSRLNDNKFSKTLHGTWRSLINNMVIGVQKGFRKRLEIIGVGYKSELKGKLLQLTVGYSHPILFRPPDNVKIEVPQPTSIIVSGIDKQVVGQVAAKIRSFRPPEPYKGKGIRYEGEYVRRKAGKAAATAGSKG